MYILGTPDIKSGMYAAWATDSIKMNHKVLIAIGLAVILFAWIYSQSRSISVEESLAVGTTQNAIAGDSPHQAISKATKGLAQKELVEAFGVAIEVSGADAEVAAREYAERTDPITGGVFVGLVQLLRLVADFRIIYLLLLLSLGPIWVMAKKLRL